MMGLSRARWEMKLTTTLSESYASERNITKLLYFVNMLCNECTLLHPLLRVTIVQQGDASYKTL